MRQQVNQGMGVDSDLASRMARMRIPTSVSSESFPTVPPPYLEARIHRAYESPPLMRAHAPSQRDSLVREA